MESNQIARNRTLDVAYKRPQIRSQPCCSVSMQSFESRLPLVPAALLRAEATSAKIKSQALPFLLATGFCSSSIWRSSFARFPATMLFAGTSCAYRSAVPRFCRYFVKLKEFSHLVSVPSSDQHLIISLSEFLDNRPEKRNMWRIVQIHPDLFASGIASRQVLCACGLKISYISFRRHFSFFAFTIRLLKLVRWRA